MSSSRWMVRYRHPKYTGLPPAYDFDAWLYHVPFPPAFSSLSVSSASLTAQHHCDITTTATPSFFPNLMAAAEDIKFTYNGYNFIRSCLYFGMPRPTVIKNVARCQPSLNIAVRGHRLFHMNCAVNTPLLPPSKAVRVGLTPHPSKGMSIDDVDWKSVVANGHRLSDELDLLLSSRRHHHDDDDDVEAEKSARWLEVARGDRGANVCGENNNNGTNGDDSSGHNACSVPGSFPIQLVVGMENGMSDEVAGQCDFCVYIPQYGSIGSLSMINALIVALHRVHTGLRGKTIPRPPCSTPSPHQSSSSSSSSSSLFAPSSTELERIAQGPDTPPSTYTAKALPPHGATWLGLNDATITYRLAMQRLRYSLQLSIVWWNNLADRNIGATVRNANIYNTEHMIVLHRKKYSRRGTVGCHHYTPVYHLSSLETMDELGLLEGYEMWCLVNDFPYFINYLYAERHGVEDLESLCGNPDCERLTLEAEEEEGAGGGGNDDGEKHNKKIISCSCDDEPALLAQLRAAKEERGCRGIALVVPDEGCSVPAHLHKRCKVALRLMQPQFVHASQAGLPGSLSTAVALDRLRHMLHRYFLLPRKEERVS